MVLKNHFPVFFFSRNNHQLDSCDCFAFVFAEMTAAVTFNDPANIFMDPFPQTSFIRSISKSRLKAAA